MMFHLQTKCFSLRAIRSIISNTGYFPEYLYHSNTDINDQSSFSKLFIIQKRKKSICPTIDKQYAYYYHPGNKPLRNETIGQLLKEAAEKWPNHECIVSHHQKVRLTFSDVLLRVDKLAAGMKKLGLKKGDRIGIFGPNDIEWFITFFCSTRLGLISTAINSAYQRDELIYCLQKVGAKAIFIPVKFKTQNYVNMVLSAKEFCPDLEHIIVWSKDHVTGTHRLIDVESLASKIEVEAISAEQDNVSSCDACNIQFTSGTTGKPKATLISHRSFVNNVEQAVNRRELRLGHKSCLNVPLFHAFGIIYGQISTILSGCTTILESRSFDPIKSLQVMAEEKCDVIYGTPTMWINMINIQQQLRLPIQARIGIIGGAPVSAELHKRVKDILGIDDMKIIYGLTELTGIVFQSLPGEDKTLTENTVGYVSDNIEVMVVNEMGDPVPFGTPGELWVRGYNSMICYYKDPENTKKILTEDGWLKTGDQFILQSNGYGQVIGRIKDLIIRGGENIFPKEIEDFLITHPSIIEAQCIGAYDKIYGEEICACIRLFEGASLSEKELKAYCKGKIAHFKIPKYVVFVANYPKTVSGKIQKGKLKEELEGKGVIPSEPK
ncbi:medium-chain acyl-CoA ligase ACSF2, mitochondrial-like isoform X3 [Vespa mandarinia]|nr:medium-chain acyl-CoA ligase ACSF2, mitochondrial-like isoform X3 [Vespa mandarinia]XP_035727590.1 medium-chain acyl-CoA ligase ACSF2, mitochondrial-like isoform X3 [Vespa mandarinia]XP_035727591.1 medium-chain acyl-CoA ligase ACSF2, mitochondrial-like isoform X3 [Vespa mandarinia]